MNDDEGVMEHSQRGWLATPPNGQEATPKIFIFIFKKYFLIFLIIF
jgi:hypothetical protein